MPYTFVVMALLVGLLGAVAIVSTPRHRNLSGRNGETHHARD
jgi:hypothetical protein